MPPWRSMRTAPTAPTSTTSTTGPMTSTPTAMRSPTRSPPATPWAALRSTPPPARSRSSTRPCSILRPRPASHSRSKPPTAPAPPTSSIAAGNALGGFAINAATGQITVLDSTVLDFETTPSFALTVQASDGTLTDTAVITVNLNNLNDNAPLINDAAVALDENSANGTNVYNVNDGADDFDADGDALTYSITAGNALGGFAINAATGQITVLDSTVLDFETTPSFALTVQASDGTRSAHLLDRRRQRPGRLCDQRRHRPDHGPRLDRARF